MDENLETPVNGGRRCKNFSKFNLSGKRTDRFPFIWGVCLRVCALVAKHPRFVIKGKTHETGRKKK